MGIRFFTKRTVRGNLTWTPPNRVKVQPYLDWNTAHLVRELQADFVSSQKKWQIFRISDELRDQEAEFHWFWARLLPQFGYLCCLLPLSQDLHSALGLLHGNSGITAVWVDLLRLGVRRRTRGTGFPNFP